jgi:hypothetical protein
MSLGIAYFAIGVVLRYIIQGDIGVPNEEFWCTLKDLISAGFRALTCREPTLYESVRN